MSKKKPPPPKPKGNTDGFTLYYDYFEGDNELTIVNITKSKKKRKKKD